MTRFPRTSLAVKTWFVVFALASCGLVNAQTQALLDLNAGMYRIEAEVMATPPTRAQGLMNRKSMEPNHGMLFVFPELNTHCMWMKNTLLPLAVAFLDERGVILNIEEMQPQTLSNHCAVQPARYALEMNAGWFKRRGFAAGTRIGGVERAPVGR